jgi:carboxypeptidase D
VVKDKSGKPIVGAMIVLNGGVRVFTAEGGYFHALLAPGNHNIEAVADGYQQQRQEVVVSSYEAASSIIIEFDMDNRIFGLPREFVVATAGKHGENCFFGDVTFCVILPDDCRELK